MGVSDEAWKLVLASGVPPHWAFCHPVVLSGKPFLLAYYRCAAGVSQKGAVRLWRGYSTRIEEGFPLDDDVMGVLLPAVNGFISAVLVDSYQEEQLTADHLFAVAAMNFGAQVNGSWRNEVGAEGTRQVRQLLLGYLRSWGAKPAKQKTDAREWVLFNGYRVVFASEPDIAVYDPSGALQGAVEIKAGLDPAGALERYGAAKKSFDAALAKNKAADTIYVATTITDAVRCQIETDRLVKYCFDLGEILSGGADRQLFVDRIRRLLDIAPGGVGATDTQQPPDRR
jgi:hypothetical protein